MNTVVTLAIKDLRVLQRDKLALFWIFAFPLMYALFFGSIFGSDDGNSTRGAISLALVDEDNSEASRALLDQLAAHSATSVPHTGEDGAGPSERLDAEAARLAVQKGRRVAYLRIPAGFGAQATARSSAPGSVTALLELGIDPLRKAEVGMLQGVLISMLLDNSINTVNSPDVAASNFGRPFEVVDVSRQREGPRSAFDVTMPQAVIWGLLSVAMGFAITLVRERSSGTLLRLRMAPIGHFELLGGKALACFLGCLATMVILTLFGLLALGLSIDSPWLMVLAMLCTAVCFTGLMMTVSVLGKTEAAVSGSSMGVMMPLAMLGGGMIPLIAMPDWMQQLARISPIRWAVVAIEGAAWRGFDLADMALPCAVLLVLGVGFFALGVVIFRRTGS